MRACCAAHPAVSHPCSTYATLPGKRRRAVRSRLTHMYVAISIGTGAATRSRSRKRHDQRSADDHAAGVTPCLGQRGETLPTARKSLIVNTSNAKLSSSTSASRRRPPTGLTRESSGLGPTPAVISTVTKR